MSFIDKILFVFYPGKCAFCGELMPYSKTGVYICGDCLKSIRFCVNEKCCPICGVPIVNDKKICDECFSLKKNGTSVSYDKIVSSCIYDKSTKNGILKFKTGAAGGSYSTFAGIIAPIVRSSLKNIDLIVAVPPRKERMIRSGFDQCHVLADKISKLLDIPYKKNAMRRIRETGKQSSLSGEMRRENLKGVFEAVIDRGIIKNKNILVIDDVKTTGSTINECAAALKKKGAAHVYGAVIAETNLER